MDGRLHAQKGPTYKKKPKPTRLVSRHVISDPDDREPFVLKASIVLGTSGHVFIDKANKGIKLLDNEFKIVDTLHLRTYPFDLCASNRATSEFYVTEPEAELVHCVKVNKGHMTVQNSLVIDEDCRGITCWKAGLAVSVMVRGFTGTLGVLDYNGKIRKKTWQSDWGSELFRAPWYLASNCDGNNIIISDQGNHSVICIEALSLVVVFVFKDLDILHGPRSIVSDSNNDVYVIGSSERCHNVVKLSPTGKFLEVLLTRDDKLNYPSGLSYNPNNATLMLQTNRDRPNVSVYRV